VGKGEKSSVIGNGVWVEFLKNIGKREI